MKLNKFAYLYSKPLGNHTLKIMKKIPGNLLKNLEKSWKYHGILSVPKSGNPDESKLSGFNRNIVWTDFVRCLGRVMYIVKLCKLILTNLLATRIAVRRDIVICCAFD